MNAKERYCKRCGFRGVHPIETHISGAQWVMLIVLLLCFVVPGVIYGIYLAVDGGSTRLWVCPNCGARRMSIPADSPLARA